MSRTAYYLSEWTDEVMPCGTSLDDWAKWLSEPAPDYGRDEPATDGSEFVADVFELYQVSAVKKYGQWHLTPPPPKNTAWMALRQGDDLGWFAEDVATDLMELSTILDGEISVHPDAAYYIACAVSKPRTILQFKDGSLTPIKSDDET